ncbi:MAG: c-type cytochrome domain-containing protein, partial [Armatimonadota bacterium]
MKEWGYGSATMRVRRSGFGWALGLGAWVVGFGAAFSAPPERPNNAGEAGKAAHRILRDRCLACHTGAAASGKLDLSSRAGLLRGGASGAVL